MFTVSQSPMDLRFIGMIAGSTSSVEIHGCKLVSIPPLLVNVSAEGMDWLGETS